MALATGQYVDVAELKETLGVTTNEHDADIADAVESASRAVDAYCGHRPGSPRRFYLPAADETRYFTATNTGLVTVDDVATLTTLATDDDKDGTYGTTWSATDYLADNNPISGEPITRFRVSPVSTSGNRFPLHRNAVKIVGKFGWPAIPTAVAAAAKIFAVRYLQRVREAPFGIITIGAEGTPVRPGRSDTEIDLLLAPYKRTGQRGARFV